MCKKALNSLKSDVGPTAKGLSTGHLPVDTLPGLAPSEGPGTGALSSINRTSLPRETPGANWPQQYSSCGH